MIHPATMPASVGGSVMDGQLAIITAEARSRRGTPR